MHPAQVVSNIFVRQSQLINMIICLRKGVDLSKIVVLCPPSYFCHAQHGHRGVGMPRIDIVQTFNQGWGGQNRGVLIF